MATASDVADYILTKIDADLGDSITQLKIQKLVYYCQAWSLAINDEPLFSEPIEAWSYGPVVRSLRDRFKDYEHRSVEPICLNDTCETLSEERRTFIDDVWTAYGHLDGSELIALTHSEDPWITAYGNTSPGMPCDEEISHESMRVFYKKRLRPQASTRKLIDLSPIKVSLIDCGDVHIAAREPFEIIPTLSDDKQLFEAVYEQFGIDTYAKTREKLIDAIQDELAFLWECYATENPDKLTHDAQLLRNNLREAFEVR